MGRTSRDLVLAMPIMIMVSAVMLGAVAHAQSSDFVLASTPSSLCVNPGVDGVSIISLQSNGDFSGTINLSDNVDPAIAGGPGSSAIPSTETLVAGQTVTFNLEISTTTSTPIGIYYVTVSGLSGSSFHQTTVQLTVSSSCAVGGSVLPINRLSLLSPYLGIAILSGAAVAIMATLALYRRGNGQRPAP
jgi:hypothetical protein